MMIQMTVQPTAPSFVVGEAVTFRLSIHNAAEGKAVVADPLLNEVEPVYTVNGLDGFSRQVRLLSARAPDPRVEPMATPAVVTMEVAAGGNWSEELTLDPMLLLRVPGRYGLQATLRAGPATVVSPVATFEMEAARVSTFGVALVPPRTLDSRLFTAWATNGPSGVRIVEAVRLDRAWGDDQRGKLYSSILYRGGTEPIAQVAVAEPLVARGMDFHGWVAWSEPGEIRAIRSNGGKPEGPTEVVYRASGELSPIAPLAMEESYDLRLYALETTGSSTAALVRVDVPRGRSGAARTSSRTLLPFAPRTAVALHAANGRTLILLAAPLGEETAIAGYEDGPIPRVTEIKRLGPWIDGRPLAACRLGDGRIQVACLAATPEVPRRTICYFAELKPNPVVVLSESTAVAGKIDPSQVRWVSLGLDGGRQRVAWRDSKGNAFVGAAPDTVFPTGNTTPLPAVFWACNSLI